MLIQIKHLCPFLLLTILFAPFAHAEGLEINVEKIEKNLFKIEGKPILVQTLNCDTRDQHQAPYLKIGDNSQTIHFRSPKKKCAVKAAYKLSTDGVGSYAVIIWNEEKDWYAIASTDSYIRTKQCDSLAQGQQAVLSLNGAHGVLIIDQLECRVEGVYTKIE